MNPLTILQDSLYFFKRNFASIFMLCMPLVMLEALARLALNQATGADSATGAQLLVGLLFYPLYTGALIRFLDAKTRGETPATADLLVATMRMWPTFAVLTILSMLLIMAGLSLFILPGVFVMIKLVFTDCLLVLKGLGPLAAMRASVKMTEGHASRILVCMVLIYLPLSVIEGVSLYLLPEQQGALLSFALDSMSGFVQLFISVVIFRLFMLITHPQNSA